MKRLGILTAVHTAQVLNRSATTTTTTTTTTTASGIKSTTASTSTTASAAAGATQTQTATTTTGIPSVLLSNVVAAHQDRGGRDLIYNNMSSNIRNGGGGRFESDLHGNVNILLGGERENYPLPLSSAARTKAYTRSEQINQLRTLIQAMLGGVIMIVFFVCYCCHKSIRKNRPSEYSQYWRTEPDINSLEVYTMDSHSMCFDRNAISLGHQIVPEELHHHQSAATTAASLSNSLPARPLTPGPPPAYESLIFKPGGCTASAATASSPSDKKPEPASLSPLSCILPVPDDEQQQQQQQQQQHEQEQQQQHQHQHRHHSSSLKEVESRRDDEGLPTYEAALKLEAHGYLLVPHYTRLFSRAFSRSEHSSNISAGSSTGSIHAPKTCSSSSNSDECLSLYLTCDARGIKNGGAMLYLQDAEAESPAAVVEAGNLLPRLNRARERGKQRRSRKCQFESQ
ncbi:unnamed protein product [Trichogramma brassicae]|uniref:Uncharacterized protein n=1 Tax=Trichogramma brassicae TaxID=86971 RepID=A0A6H5IFR0_9HYME|nr:unnamed protein product [Trichogramma brassicae]